jgi:hypothetical protein
MMPLGDTFRIRLLPRSAMNIFRELSTATSTGANKAAAVAGPPSPEKRMTLPFPATVVSTPTCPDARKHRPKQQTKTLLVNRVISVHPKEQNSG